VGLVPGGGAGKCWLVTGVMGGEMRDGVEGLGKYSFARYGGDVAPRDGEDGGDELGCRKGEELKYEDDDDEEVNVPELNAGEDGGWRLNRW